MNISDTHKKNKANEDYFSFAGLRNENAKARAYLALVILFALLAILTTFTFYLSVLLIERNQIHNKGLLFFSFIKSWFLLYIIYLSAKNRAAQYLNDIFELADIKLASTFIEKVVFGGENERITIDKGNIIQEEEKSHLIRIGGPGEIQVNLGNIALYETVNGAPRILKSSNFIWEINSFERLREIGNFDDDGKRKYAIIDTHDQFVSGLNLVSRTKDGIPIQIEDIKVTFSILRSSEIKKNEHQKDPFTFDEEAIKSLIYKQNVMSKSYDLPTGIQFPWDTTIIPLILSELEKLIQTYTLSEIFASISEIETSEIKKREKEVEELNEKIKSAPAPMKDNKKSYNPIFIPRPAITEKFYSIDFKDKASKLGVSLKWIDIGTWKIDDRFSFLLDKFKEAHDLAVQNKKLASEIKKSESAFILKGIVEIVNEQIISNLEKNNVRVLDKQELVKLAKTIRENPELSNPRFIYNLIKERLDQKNSESRIIETLKAFRIELLEAKELIITEGKASSEVDLEKINNAIRNIEKHIFRFL